MCVCVCVRLLPTCTHSVWSCFCSLSISFIHSGSGDQAKNVAVALRCLANLFSSSEGALLMVTCRQHVSVVCVCERTREFTASVLSPVQVFQALDAQGDTSNRTAQIALATIILK